MNALEASYLERVLLHLKHGDPDDRMLKTYMDSWFAHVRGGGMLETTGRPQWANRGDLEKHDHLCDEAHAISVAAQEARRAGDRSALVRDHTIPKAIIVAELKRRDWSNINAVGSFLKLWFTVTILTQSEHNGIGFRSRMPGPCTDELLRADRNARFARYRQPAVKVEFVLLPLAREWWG